MKVVAIIQARMGSTRLPGKVMADIAGKPMLAHVFDRAAQIRGVDEVVLATSSDRHNQVLVDLAHRLGIVSYSGSEDDVLDRYYRAAKSNGADIIVRITADCPLLDPDVSAAVVERVIDGRADYASNVHPPFFPDGLDTEALTFLALEQAWRDATLPSDREHVTPFIWRNPDRFRAENVRSEVDLSSLRWTVDDISDLQFARAVLERLGDRASMADVLALLGREPELCGVNSRSTRNEGYTLSLERDSVQRAVEESE